MLRKFGIFSATLFLCALFTIQSQTALAARGAPIYEPDPIPVGKASVAQARNAVRKALLRRSWEGKEQGAGHYVATYSKPKFNVSIDITYDAKAVRIKYKDSEGLNYQKDGSDAVIHANYNKWIKNLEKDISLELADFN